MNKNFLEVYSTLNDNKTFESINFFPQYEELYCYT